VWYGLVLREGSVDFFCNILLNIDLLLSLKYYFVDLGYSMKFVGGSDACNVLFERERALS